MFDEPAHSGTEHDGNARSAAPGPGKERRHTAFFDVINASLAIHTPEQFCAWMRGDLQRIFPHGMMVCGVGEIENLGSRVRQIIACNFPREYIQTVQHPDGLTRSPLIAQWIETRRPVLFEMTNRHADAAWLENFKRFDLRNMAAHGLCDMQSHTTSYFAFAQIPGKLTPRHAGLLEMLVPHLHVALTRALSGAKQQPSPGQPAPSALTGRERQILQWMSAGKTNWEIAQVLHISENTVKNHVQRILIKLKVNTRAQAVAKGLPQ